MNRNRGFTLIEILVLLCIFASIILISFPVLSYFRQNVELGTVAKEIVSDLRFAQENAITKSSMVEVRFEKDGNYLISQYDYFEKNYLKLKEINLSRAIKLKYQKTIRFSKTGFPPPGGSGTIILINKSGKTKKIIVSSVGRIRME